MLINKVLFRCVLVGWVTNGFALAQPAAAPASPDRSAGEAEFIALRDAYLSKYKPLWCESEQAWWSANTTGSNAAFQRKKGADTALVELHSDGDVFARLKSLKEGGLVTDPLLARELDVMYRAFLPGQTDPALQKRIVALQNDVEQIFNTHRSLVNGRKMTENDVRDVLKNSRDSSKVEEAWKGYMDVGRKVESGLRRLVKLRNQVARELGFESFYDMQLVLQEIEQERFFKLFDELDELTREPFAKLKAEIDGKMAARFGVAEGDLRPWHFGDLFFQEAPAVQEVNLDDLFAAADLIALSKKYYASLGMVCDDILARSDLYEKEGKSPHAFSADLDRAGDIRVLCNLKPNVIWADTLMHELGHAVYDKYIRDDVPFLLRTPSHGITTEGVALMFGAMVKNEDWLVNVLGMEAAEAAKVVQAARSSLRTEKILFSRWAQVMVRFEHEMYSNPDQDLSKLWWDLKQRYQLLNPPDDLSLPGYGAKMHVVGFPVYYHSYMMGDLFAAQMHACIARRVLRVDDPAKTSFFANPEAGEFLRDNVFGPGNTHSWNELTRRATGEYLTAKHFAEQFVD